MLHGTEMEYSILTRDRASKLVAPESFNGGFYNYLPDNFKCLPRAFGDGVFLGNGGSLYLDMQKPEYDTPENTSFYGTIAHEIAGERIVYALMQAIVASESSGITNFVLNKRVIDDPGHVWGYHESYATQRQKIRYDACGENDLATIGLHLATRNLFCGAGAVRLDPKGNAEFVIAQKAIGLETDVSSTSCANHPLVDIRDEALANDRLYRRVHITCGDANMSPWATMVKLGSTAIVLRAIQAGYIKRNLALHDSGISAYQYAGEVARDQTFRKTVRLATGQYLNALDFQSIYIEAGLKLEAAGQLPLEEMEILEQWQQAHELLSTNPDKLADSIDWLGKKTIMEKLAGMNLEVDQEGNNNRINVNSSNIQLCRKIDRRWDELGPAGLSPIMRAGPWQAWLPDEAAIIRAMTTAPTTTRAHIRGQIVNFLTRRADIKINWHIISFEAERHFGLSEIHLPDPRATTNCQVDELIARHQAVA